MSSTNSHSEDISATRPVGEGEKNPHSTSQLHVSTARILTHHVPPHIHSNEDRGEVCGNQAPGHPPTKKRNSLESTESDEKQKLATPPLEKGRSSSSQRYYGNEQNVIRSQHARLENSGSPYGASLEALWEEAESLPYLSHPLPQNKIRESKSGVSPLLPPPSRSEVGPLSDAYLMSCAFPGPDRHVSSESERGVTTLDSKFHGLRHGGAGRSGSSGAGSGIFEEGGIIEGCDHQKLSQRRSGESALFSGLSDSLYTNLPNGPLLQDFNTQISDLHLNSLFRNGSNTSAHSHLISGTKGGSGTMDTKFIPRVDEWESLFSDDNGFGVLDQYPAQKLVSAPPFPGEKWRTSEYRASGLTDDEVGKEFEGSCGGDDTFGALGPERIEMDATFGMAGLSDWEEEGGGWWNNTPSPPLATSRSLKLSGLEDQLKQLQDEEERREVLVS